MSIILRASLIGAVAGLRTVVAPAAVSWAASSGNRPLRGTSLFFLGEPVSAYVFAALALGELVTDKLPAAPSRLIPFQLGARLLSGAVCGAAIGAPGRKSMRGLVCGAAAAAAGAIAGHTARMALIRAVGRTPAALIEDAVAIAGAWLLTRSR